MRPDRVGDVVLSTPVFHTLKDSFGGCFVGALVSSYTAPLLRGNPNIDVVITDDPGSGEKQGGSFRKKVREISSYNFDVALLLLPTKRLAYMLFLAGIPYRVGVGHILYEVITLMRGVSRHKYNPLRHESDYMLDLARRIKARYIWKKPEIFLTWEEKGKARDYLLKKGFDKGRALVCVHPGSGHSSPNWDPARYAELVAMLAKAGVQVLVTGAESEREHESLFTEHDVPGVKTAFGELSLVELAAVESQVDVFVSSSTGPMHMAAAVGTKTVSMFCPLTACSPKLWGPIGNVSRVILPSDDFCTTKCPGDPHICTFESGEEGIAVETVYDATMEFLRENQPEAQYLKESTDDNSTSHGR